MLAFKWFVATNPLFSGLSSPFVKTCPYFQKVVYIKTFITPFSTQSSLCKGENILWVTIYFYHNLIIGHGTKIK
jgi:hypothetical protein